MLLIHLRLLMYVATARALSAPTFCALHPFHASCPRPHSVSHGFHPFRAPAAAGPAWEIHVCCGRSGSACDSGTRLTCQGPPAPPIRAASPPRSPRLAFSIVRPSSASFVFATDLAFDRGPNDLSTRSHFSHNSPSGNLE